MPFTVYVLYSPTFLQTYVGQTHDLVKRLARHNVGEVRSTRRYCPWEVAYVEQFETRADAMQREKWMKSGAGREFIAEVVKGRL